jgi:hypothetical protein
VKIFAIVKILVPEKEPIACRELMEESGAQMEPASGRGEI